MTLQEFLTHTNYALRGTDDDAPELGTDEANQWVATLNRKKNELYETGQWRAAWQEPSIATITASATPNYDMEDEFIEPSDQVYVITTTGEKKYYDIVKPQERNNSQQVYIAGYNPEVIYFTQEIKSSDDIVGGTLYVPGYYMPADVSESTDKLPLPDPFWGVMSVAAEAAFNDITYEDKAVDLNNKANALYRAMVRKNRRGTYNNPRVSATNVRRITSPETR